MRLLSWILLSCYKQEVRPSSREGNAVLPWFTLSFVVWLLLASVYETRVKSLDLKLIEDLIVEGPDFAAVLWGTANKGRLCLTCVPGLKNYFLVQILTLVKRWEVQDGREAKVAVFSRSEDLWRCWWCQASKIGFRYSYFWRSSAFESSLYSESAVLGRAGQVPDLLKDWGFEFVCFRFTTRTYDWGDSNHSHTRLHCCVINNDCL